MSYGTKKLQQVAIDEAKRQAGEEKEVAPVIEKKEDVQPKPVAAVAGGANASEDMLADARKAKEELANQPEEKEEVQEEVAVETPKAAEAEYEPEDQSPF